METLDYDLMYMQSLPSLRFSKVQAAFFLAWGRIKRVSGLGMPPKGGGLLHVSPAVGAAVKPDLPSSMVRNKQGKQNVPVIEEQLPRALKEMGVSAGGRGFGPDRDSQP